MEQLPQDSTVAAEQPQKEQCRMRGLVHQDVTNYLLVIAGFDFLVAAFFCVLSLIALLNGNLFGFFDGIVGALLFGLPAYGLLKLNRWARLFQLIASMLLLLLGLLMIYGKNMVFGPVLVIIFGLIAIYLLSEPCLRIFKRKTVVVEDAGT